MIRCPRRHALAIVLVAIAAVPACGDKSKQAAPVNRDAVVPALAQAPAAPPVIRKADYWAPILAVMTGTYGTACRAFNLEGEPPPKDMGPIVVAADGKVSVRSFTSGRDGFRYGYMWSSLLFNGAPDLSSGFDTGKIDVSVHERGNGDKLATFGPSPNLFECDSAAKVATPSIRVYPRYAHLLDTKTTLRCLHGKTKQREDLVYEVGQHMLKIGPEEFELDLLKSETVSIRAGEDVTYGGYTPDLRSFTVHLDPYARVNKLTVEHAGRALYTCERIGPAPAAAGAPAAISPAGAAPPASPRSGAH